MKSTFPGSICSPLFLIFITFLQIVDEKEQDQQERDRKFESYANQRGCPFVMRQFVGRSRKSQNLPDGWEVANRRQVQPGRMERAKSGGQWRLGRMVESN
jgi:hypothetical protein